MGHGIYVCVSHLVWRGYLRQWLLEESRPVRAGDGYGPDASCAVGPECSPYCEEHCALGFMCVISSCFVMAETESWHRSILAPLHTADLK